VVGIVVKVGVVPPLQINQLHFLGYSASYKGLENGWFGNYIEGVRGASPVRRNIKTS